MTTANAAHVPYTAETYTAILSSGRVERGWTVKHGDDTVCDVIGGPGDADRIAALLNASASTSSDGGADALPLPDIDRENQAILLGTLRLLDLQLSQPPTPKMLAVMRRMVRCALGQHTAGRESQ